MRGQENDQGTLFSYVDLEKRIPAKHPLREIKILVDGVLASMSHEFDLLYSHTGRPSIPPERLLRALLLQVLYTVRSERQLVEQPDYNLLFRWFVGLGLEDEVWDRSVFGANRDRLLSEGVVRGFFDRVLGIAKWQGLASDEHFSVDGSLIDAWASHKSFQPKESDPPPPAGRNPDVDFKGKKRSNETHQSRTDPESRLYKKGTYTEAKLRFITHVLNENRNGLIVDVHTTQATGKAEIEAASLMTKRSLKPGSTLGADKGYDQRRFVKALKDRGIKGHIARKDKGSAVDGRTARGKGYAKSLKRRKRIEETFGWLKTVGGLRQSRHRGLDKLAGQSLLCYAAYNLVRLQGVMLISTALSAQEINTPESSVQDVEGNAYRTVKIGNQEWLAENLRSTKYQDGSTIKTAFIPKDKEDNLLKYGRLYDWNDVSDERNICPVGWRVASDDDWKALEKDIGMPEQDLNKTGWRGANNIGASLKESQPDTLFSKFDQSLVNTHGFSARPAGIKWKNWYFVQGMYAEFWTSSEATEKDAYNRTFAHSWWNWHKGDIYRSALSKTYAFSVRCVKI